MQIHLIYTKNTVYDMCQTHTKTAYSETTVGCTWYEEYMQIKALFFPSPSLPPWSVAIPKVERKLGLVASSGALSLATEIHSWINKLNNGFWSNEGQI